MTIVALIPARGGSKRIPRKNIKLLGGKPLIQWTIDAAKASGIFEDVIVSSDDPETNGIAMDCGDVIVCPRPPEFARDDSPDIQWVRYTLNECCSGIDAFAILRPTSPFRTADTIRRAYAQFEQDPEADSLRAVQRWQGPHPGKMWMCDYLSHRMFPVMTGWTTYAPYHSSPTQSLMPIYVQNASLEMAYTRVPFEKGSIAGDEIAPFFTEGWEGDDINTPDDWDLADAHARHLLARV